jgi:2-C-methyl-D-erythritol 4-phosphate cytidylyltransferase/2-C-methyl-D-erythritol 2,4-cyclodiphosphate synthase
MTGAAAGVGAVIDGVLAALDTHPGAAPALAVTDALWRGDGTVDGHREPRGALAGADAAGLSPGCDSRGARAHPRGRPPMTSRSRARPDYRSRLPKATSEYQDHHGPGGFRPRRTAYGGRMDIRTGNGYDVHRFGPGDHVMLCGVAVPHERGLQGHSDADVGCIA